MGKEDLGASSGAEGWKDVLQLLKEQNDKMEKLARALSVIQQGMLRNNPGFVKDSVNEATEVLSGMLNTHKCLLESGVKIQKKMESHPAMKKLGDLSETTFGVSGRYPKKAGEGRKKICALSPSGKNSQKGEGWLFALLC